MQPDFHPDFKILVDQVVELLRARGETLSFAESCTGGLLSAVVAAQPGVSDVYMGSVVAYANRIKEKILGVPDDLIKEFGAVSPQVAQAMARGVCERLETTWAISITGVAGPGGGSPYKPVGTVCFGLAGPRREGQVSGERVEQQSFQGDRGEIQAASAAFALRFLLAELKRSS